MLETRQRPADDPACVLYPTPKRCQHARVRRGGIKGGAAHDANAHLRLEAAVRLRFVRHFGAQGDVQHLPVAPDIKFKRCAFRRFNSGLQLAEGENLCPVNRGDHIAAFQTGLIGRGLRHHLLDQRWHDVRPIHGHDFPATVHLIGQRLVQRDAGESIGIGGGIGHRRQGHPADRDDLVPFHQFILFKRQRVHFPDGHRVTRNADRQADGREDQNGQGKVEHRPRSDRGCTRP